jgi:hypothetical protein
MSNEIKITSYRRDAEDYRGKEHAIVYHCIIGGREKAVGKADLLRAIEMNLPEEGSDESVPLLDRNGSG